MNSLMSLYVVKSKPLPFTKQNTETMISLHNNLMVCINSDDNIGYAFHYFKPWNKLFVDTMLETITKGPLDLISEHELLKCDPINARSTVDYINLSTHKLVKLYD